MVRVVANDGEMEVSADVLRQVKFLAVMLEDEELEDAASIPLPLIRLRDLERLVEFLVHYKQHPIPAIKFPIKPTDKLEDLLGNDHVWYTEFLGSPLSDETQSAICSSHYVDCEALLYICLAYVAVWIRTKTPYEIYQEANKPPPTPEELQKLHEEYSEMIREFIR